MPERCAASAATSDRRSVAAEIRTPILCFPQPQFHNYSHVGHTGRRRRQSGTRAISAPALTASIFLFRPDLSADAVLMKECRSAPASRESGHSTRKLREYRCRGWYGLVLSEDGSGEGSRPIARVLGLQPIPPFQRPVSGGSDTRDEPTNIPREGLAHSPD